MDQWKIEAIKNAEGKGIISPGEHKPGDSADKGFVLAVVVNGIDYAIRQFVKLMGK